MSEQSPQSPELNKETELAGMFQTFVKKYAKDSVPTDEGYEEFKSVYSLGGGFKYDCIEVSMHREVGSENGHANLLLTSEGSHYLEIGVDETGAFSDGEIFDGKNPVVSEIVAESIFQDLSRAEEDGRFMTEEDKRVVAQASSMMLTDLLQGSEKGSVDRAFEFMKDQQNKDQK